jgi:hypothetical protein
MKGCVGWWPLTDGGGGIAKDLLGRNDGTLAGQSGGLPTWEQSTLGTALESNGTQERRVEITNDFMSSKSAMSVSLWSFLDSWTGYDTHFAYSGLDRLFTMQTLTVAGGNYRYQFLTNNLSGNTDLRTPEYTFELGRWQHIVCTYDGSVKKVYFDGVEVASASASGTVGTPTKDTDILTTQGAGYNIDGKMQNVRVYNRALSATEILQLYTNPWSGLSMPSETRYFYFPTTLPLSETIGTFKMRNLSFTPKSGGRTIIRKPS